MWKRNRIEVLDDTIENKYPDLGYARGCPNLGYVCFEIRKIDYEEQFIMYHAIKIIYDIVYIMKYGSLGAYGNLPFAPSFVCGYHSLYMKLEARNPIYRNEELHEYYQK